MSGHLSAEQAVVAFLEIKGLLDKARVSGFTDLELHISLDLSGSLLKIFRRDALQDALGLMPNVHTSDLGILYAFTAEQIVNLYHRENDYAIIGRSPARTALDLTAVIDAGRGVGSIEYVDDDPDSPDFRISEFVVELSDGSRYRILPAGHPEDGGLHLVVEFDDGTGADDGYKEEEEEEEEEDGGGTTEGGCGCGGLFTDDDDEPQADDDWFADDVEDDDDPGLTDEQEDNTFWA